MKIRKFNPEKKAELQRVFELQQAAYAAEAKLIGAAAFPPLHGTINEMQRSTDEAYVAVEDTSFGHLQRVAISSLMSFMIFLSRWGLNDK